MTDNKYGARRTVYAGQVSDSAGEAAYAAHLDALKAADAAPAPRPAPRAHLTRALVCSAGQPGGAPHEAAGDWIPVGRGPHRPLRGPRQEAQVSKKQHARAW
jgi:hypothetical protein